MKYPITNTAIGKFGKMIDYEETMNIYDGVTMKQGGKQASTNADYAIRLALNAGKTLMFGTSDNKSWKAHFTKRFPDATIEEVEGGLRISK